MLQLWTNAVAEQCTCNSSLLQPNKWLICKADLFSGTSWWCVLWWDFFPRCKKTAGAMFSSKNIFSPFISETEGIFQPLASSRQQRRNFNFIEKLARPTHIPISQNLAGVQNCLPGKPNDGSISGDYKGSAGTEALQQAWEWEERSGVETDFLRVSVFLNMVAGATRFRAPPRILGTACWSPPP